jgi:DNA replication protein DnaC
LLQISEENRMQAPQSKTYPQISDPPEPTADDGYFESAHCPRHGEFQQKVMAAPFPGVPPFGTGCSSCREEATAATKARAKRDAAFKLHQRICGLIGAAGIPPRFQNRRFENYQAETRAQEHALAVCGRFAKKWAELHEKGTSLILTGGPGTGKTHLACAIASSIIGEHQAIVRFVTAAEMLRRIKETYGRESTATESEVIKGFCRCELLIIDEIGVQQGSEHETRLLFEILNDRYGSLMPTILLSNMSADDLELYLGHRVMDRFRESGAVVPFDWGSHRGRRSAE